jgi:hypothetical protein
VTERESALRGDVADLRAAIERAAADLAVAEEPAGFAAALDAGAPPAEPEATP